MVDQERIELKDFSEGMKIIDDKVINEIYSEFHKDFPKELKMQGIFLSKGEIRDGILERFYDSINEKYLDLKSRVSYLRKKGKYVNCDDYNLLRVPLKIKMMQANLSKETYLIVMEILREVEGKVVDVEGVLEKDEEEHEKFLLEREKKWEEDAEKLAKIKERVGEGEGEKSEVQEKKDSKDSKESENKD